MKQLSFLCFLLVLLFSNSAFSQNDDFSKKQLKFYFNTINEGYVENRVSSNDRFVKNITKVGIPSIAYAWQKSENQWQEIEFSAFFDRNQDVLGTGSFNERTGYISARYELNRILLGSEKVDFSLGGGFQTFYLHNSFAPMTSSDFPFYYNGLHNNLSIIPRLRFKLEKFTLDFNMLYSVMQLNLTSFREDNPSLSRLEETQSGINYELFPNSYFLQARVGIAVDLN